MELSELHGKVRQIADELERTLDGDLWNAMDSKDLCAIEKLNRVRRGA